MSSPGADGQEPPIKRQRQGETGQTPAAASAAAAAGRPTAPYDLDSPVHLLRVRGLSARHNAGCRGARLGSLVAGPLRLALVSNFMVDMGWLMSACPDLARAQTLLVVHGEQPDMEPVMRMQAAAAGAPHAQLHRPPLPIAFGTHHSKAFLLTYPTGLRLIVFTGNAIYADCNDKTQGLWVQDFPRKLPPPAAAAAGAAAAAAAAAAAPPPLPSPFERDLVAYFRALALPAAMAGPAFEAIAAHDFTHARGSLVASVPGYHRGPAMHAFGHMRLRRLLEQVPLPPGFASAAAGAAATPAASAASGSGGAAAEGLVIQCSSMGSFDQAWLIDQFGASLAAHRRTQSLQQAGPMNGPPRPTGPPGCGALPLAVVWPTVEEVRNSIEGWFAGRSIPGPAKNVGKPFMRRYYARWGGEAVGRQRAMPHIKSYTRYRGQQLAWFLVTSHNLSKAAWGELQKNGTQLMIRSYELGVLVTPAQEAAYRVSPHYGFCCTDGVGGAAGSGQAQRPAATAQPRDVKFLSLAGAAAVPRPAASDDGPSGGADASAAAAEAAEALTVAVPVPYALPPVPYKYDQGDQPWTVDEPRAGVDALGMTWGTPMSHYGHTEPTGD